MKKVEVSIRAKLILNQKMIGTEQGDLKMHVIRAFSAIIMLLLPMRIQNFSQ